MEPGLVLHGHFDHSIPGSIGVFVENENSRVGPVVQVVDFDGRGCACSHRWPYDVRLVVIGNDGKEKTVEHGTWSVVWSLPHNALERGALNRIEEMHAFAFNDDPLHSNLYGPDGSRKGICESIDSLIGIHQSNILEKYVIRHELRYVVSSVVSEPSLKILGRVILTQQIVDSQVRNIWKDHSSN